MKTKKELKAEYDKEYRKRKSEEIKLKKKLYAQSEKGRAMQKRQREKRKEYHNAYCRTPEQREKEKKRRHIRENKIDLKICIVCNKEKQIIEFENFPVFPDRRNYQCKECEHKQQKELGLTTRNVLQCFRSGLIKSKSKLKISDIVKYPYLIEANKYLLLLKQLTK